MKRSHVGFLLLIAVSTASATAIVNGLCGPFLGGFGSMQLRQFFRAATSAGLKGMVHGRPPDRWTKDRVVKLEHAIAPRDGVDEVTVTWTLESGGSLTLRAPACFVSPVMAYVIDGRLPLHSMYADPLGGEDAVHPAFTDHRFTFTTAFLDRLPRRIPRDLQEQLRREVDAYRRLHPFVVGAGWFIDEPAWDLSLDSLTRAAVDPSTLVQFRWGAMIPDDYPLSDTEINRHADHVFPVMAAMRRALQDTLSADERRALDQYARFVLLQRFFRLLAYGESGEKFESVFWTMSNEGNAGMQALIDAGGTPWSNNRDLPIDEAQAAAERQANRPGPIPERYRLR